MKLSIIIVSWNTRTILQQCLRSVEAAARQLDPGTVEVFVVDNQSSDGSATMVQREFEWVNAIENQKNVGFARANNQAFRQCTGEYVLLLNPDTVVDEDALKALVAFVDTHLDAGIVGANLLNPDRTLQTSCYPAPTLTREIWRLFHLDTFYSYGSYRMQDWPLHLSREVEVVQGACLLLRRSALPGTEVLDEEYFIYTEEVDLCQRVRKDGWRIYWAPHVRVVHYGGQSTKQMAQEMFLRLYESKVIYFRKHYGNRGKHLYKLILLGATFSRLLLSPLAFLQPAERRRQHLALADSYLHLLRSLPGW